MTFDELVEEVYTITNRSDLTAATKAAVKAATLKGHKTDFYSKDIYEQGVEMVEADFTHSLDYINLISNFRAFKYVRRVTGATDDAGTFIEIITPEELLDEYGQGRTDVAYVAGRVLEIKASVSFQYFLLGCYVLPIVTESNYSSWIAEQCPYYIIYEASRVLFRQLGQLEESNGYAQLAAEELQLLKQGALTDVGF